MAIRAQVIIAMSLICSASILSFSMVVAEVLR